MGEYADSQIDYLERVHLGVGDPPYHRERKYKRMANYSTVFVSGKIYWPKIVGDKALHDNYDGDAREWSYEFVPDDVGFLKEHKLLDRLKDKEDPKNPDKGDFLVLRKPELNKDGEKNDPIRIYDADNNEWDGRMIGNGTAVDVKLRIVDWGKGKKSSIWTQAIRVTELVPYETSEFAGMDGDEFPDNPKKNDKKASKPQTNKGKSKDEFDDDELNDDIPF